MVNKLVAAAAVDPAAEKDGAWFEYTKGGQTFRVRIAKSGTSNAEFMKTQARLLKPWRAGAKGGNAPEIPPEADRQIMRQIYAQTVVKDWEAEDFGETFTPDRCIETFRLLDDFLTWVVNISAEQDNFRKAEIEEAQGNL